MKIFLIKKEQRNVADLIEYYTTDVLGAYSNFESARFEVFKLVLNNRDLVQKDDLRYSIKELEVSQ